MPMAVFYFIVLIYRVIVLVGGCYCCKRNSHVFRFCNEWHNSLGDGKI